MTDWRADIIRSLADEKRMIRMVTFDSALELIDQAAYNRRMSRYEFCGRASLAVAAFDADEPWYAVTKKEPPLHDLRRREMPARRKYGRDFGPWQITGMTK